MEKDLAKRLAKVSERVEKDLEERERLILFAFAQGASLRDIGDAAGMTHVGVKKLVERIQADYIIRDKSGRILAVIECKTNPPRDFDPSQLEKVVHLDRRRRESEGEPRKR